MSGERAVIGEYNANNYGSVMTVIDKNHGILTVKFDNGFEKKVRTGNFRRGSVKSPYCKTVCGIGYIGIGKYSVTNDGDVTDAYDTWASMLKRCYVSESHYSAYNGCVVCEEWHNFQNFAEWYNCNYYQIEGENMCLDKDIIHKGNKIYSPDTCVFVPRKINNIFTNRKNHRGKLPIGVTKRHGQRYIARCENLISSTRDEAGRYDTAEDAFIGYKKYKEKYIKEVADLYKEKIPKTLYDAMYCYEVDIND